MTQWVSPAEGARDCPHARTQPIRQTALSQVHSQLAKPQLMHLHAKHCAQSESTQRLISVLTFCRHSKAASHLEGPCLMPCRLSNAARFRAQEHKRAAALLTPCIDRQQLVLRGTRQRWYLPSTCQGAAAYCDDPGCIVHQLSLSCVHGILCGTLHYAWHGGRCVMMHRPVRVLSDGACLDTA